MAVGTPSVGWVPSDFEFLDPERPDVRYEGDLSDEERAQDAEALDAMHAREGEGSVPPMTYLDSLGQPPAKKRRRRRKS